MVKLEQGQILKSYKEVCEILDVKPTNGKGKKSHIKDFERYCTYHKQGNKFIIDEVFETPKPKIDNRLKGNNSIYIKYIQVLLLDYLQQQDGNVATFPATQFYKNLGMVNQKYKMLEVNATIKENNVDVTNWEMRQFYLNSGSKLKTILMSALKNLKNRFILEFHETWQITDIKGDTFFADDEQIENILDVQKNILARFYSGCNLPYLYLSGKVEQFYSKVDEQLFDLYKWQKVYKVIKINFSNKYIPYEKEYTLNQMEKLIQKKELNTLVVNALHKNTDTIYNNQQTKWENAFEKTKKEIIKAGLNFGDVRPSDENVHDMTGVFNYPCQFVKIQKMLIDDLVQL